MRYAHDVYMNRWTYEKRLQIILREKVHKNYKYKKLLCLYLTDYLYILTMTSLSYGRVFCLESQ